MAGARKLRNDGTIAAGDRVVCVLTGHQLKDPDTTVAYHSSSNDAVDELLVGRGIESISAANSPQTVGNQLEEILKSVRRHPAG